MVPGQLKPDRGPITNRNLSRLFVAFNNKVRASDSILVRHEGEVGMSDA